MQAFEKEFETYFSAIRKKCGAYLFFLHPPTRCVGSRGTMPVFVQTGRALYDVSGWLPTNVDGDKVAQAIGIELKACKQCLPSMRIVGQDGHGSGVQAHQLEALAAVHRDGGIARLLWCNGGVVGVLDGEDIAKAFHDYGVSVQVEKMGKTVAKGSRSIPWGLFRTFDLHADPSAVIIAPVKDPTIKQVLAKIKKRTAKQLEDADVEAKIIDKINRPIDDIGGVDD